MRLGTIMAGLGMAAVLGLVGCQAEARISLAKVHGKVTVKGKPLTSGRVLFLPTASPGEGLPHPAAGDIKPDGTYELTTNAPGDGALVGDHKVAVIAMEPPPPRGAKAEFKSLIPKKYGNPESSPLKKTVVAGENTIDIEIDE